MNRILSRIITLAVFGLLLAPVAIAQDATDPDQTLTAFAQAYADAEEMQADYQAQIDQTEDVEEAERLRADLDTRIDGAIEARGLTRAGYDDIVQRTQADAEVSQRVMALVDQERSNRARGWGTGARVAWREGVGSGVA